MTAARLAACAGQDDLTQTMYTERSKVTPKAATAARTSGESVTPKPGASLVTRANIMRPSTSSDPFDDPVPRTVVLSLDDTFRVLEAIEDAVDSFRVQSA